jgi:hypothetical protein
VIGLGKLELQKTPTSPYPLFRTTGCALTN